MTFIRGRRGQRTKLASAGVAALAIAVGAWTAGVAAPARAVVLVFDGFGDADLNNNGTALEPSDVDVNGAGDGTVAPYIALANGGSPPVYPADTMVNEVTAVEDAFDDGIRWYSIGGWTGAPTPSATSDPRASVKILSDAAGALPETNSQIGYLHAAEAGGPGARRFAEAIDDGLALSWDSKGRGNNAAGFFDNTIELGPAVNDEVRLSFDFRLWYSAANLNTNVGINHVPHIGELRFGLYEDTDNQLGLANPKAGQLATTTVDDPAIWGQANGNFRGDAGATTLAGANGDHGWFVRLPIDDPENDTVVQLPSQDIGRINEELNEGAVGDLRIMNGATDFVAGAPEGFPYLDIDKVYRLSLSLKRFDDPTTPETIGDTIFAEVTVTERATNQSVSFSDYDSVGVAAGGDPDGGFESDAWDYFTMTTGGNTTSDDFDWLIDNFTIDVIGSNADADFNNDDRVDGADFLIWQRGLGLTGQTSNANGDATADGVVDRKDLAIWRASLGDPPNIVAAGGAIPEPATLGSAVTCVLASIAALRRRAHQR